jgi:hypothetical protein
MKVEGEGRHVVLKRLAANLSGKSRGRQSTSLACLYGPRGSLMPRAGNPYRLHCHTSSSTARVPVSFCIDEKHDEMQSIYMNGRSESPQH